MINHLSPRPPLQQNSEVSWTCGQNNFIQTTNIRIFSEESPRKPDVRTRALLSLLEVCVWTWRKCSWRCWERVYCRTWKWNRDHDFFCRLFFVDVPSGYFHLKVKQNHLKWVQPSVPAPCEQQTRVVQTHLRLHQHTLLFTASLVCGWKHLWLVTSVYKLQYVNNTLVDPERIREDLTCVFVNHKIKSTPEESEETSTKTRSQCVPPQQTAVSKPFAGLIS